MESAQNWVGRHWSWSAYFIFEIFVFSWKEKYRDSFIVQLMRSWSVRLSKKIGFSLPNSHEWVEKEPIKGVCKQPLQAFATRRRLNTISFYFFYENLFHFYSTRSFLPLCNALFSFVHLVSIYLEDGEYRLGVVEWEAILLLSTNFLFLEYELFFKKWLLIQFIFVCLFLCCFFFCFFYILSFFLSFFL